MAEQKNKKKTTTTRKTTTHRTSSTWGINKTSFYTIAAVAILYLVATILSLCGVNFKIVSALQGVSTAIMICIVAVLAWRYVRPKQTVWKILYVVFLLVVLIGVVLPLVM